MTPTQRSLAFLKADGWTVAVVEKWNPHVRIRQDLFGFADLIAMRPGAIPILVQCTSTGWASRVAKILEAPLAAVALRSGFQIEVHGWRKLKTNRGRWTIKRLPITETDLENVHSSTEAHRQNQRADAGGTADPV